MCMWVSFLVNIEVLPNNPDLLWLTLNLCRVSPMFCATKTPTIRSGRRVAGHCRHSRRINHGESCGVLVKITVRFVLQTDGLWTQQNYGATW